MTNKHTELPWRVDSAPWIGLHFGVLSKSNETVCFCPERQPDRDKANAHLIVTACNYHHRLREALVRVDRDMQKQGKVRQETMCNIDGLLYELDNLEK